MAALSRTNHPTQRRRPGNGDQQTLQNADSDLDHTQYRLDVKSRPTTLTQQERNPVTLVKELAPEASPSDCTRAPGRLLLCAVLQVLLQY